MKKSLFRSLFTVSAFTFLSRIMGLVRDIVFASFFGASLYMDAFSVAFRIPNLFRRFFGEGAFNQAFVPVFSEYRIKKERAELKLFLAEISGTLGIVLLLIAVVGVLASPLVVMLFASGFMSDAYVFEITNNLLKWMLPYLFFICMTAMYSSTLNALDKFAVPAGVPILLNICLIGGAFLSSLADEPIYVLGYAVFLAGIVQLLTVFYAVYREGLIARPRVAFKSKGVRTVMFLMIPAIIGSSSSQINILINTQLASRLETGSITWLYYSDRLVEFAIGTFAVALGTVVLPRLSQLNAKEDYKSLGQTIDWGLTLALVIGLPATIALVILAEPLLALLFMRGAFTVNDVMMASRSLVTYALSIPAFFLIRVLAPVFFSRQDTKTPVKYSLIAIATNIVLQFILVEHLQHAGLALSSAIAAWVNAGLLMMGIVSQGIHNFSGLMRFRSLAILPANLLLIAGLMWVGSFSTFWFEAGLLMRFSVMMSVVVVAVVGYFALIHLSGLKLQTLKEPDRFI